MPARVSIGLLATIVSFVTACDPGSPTEEGSDPSRSSQTLSETNGNNGQVGVRIRVNHDPVITAMNADWLGPRRQEFSAQTSDRDGDALSLTWSVNCAGTFDEPRATRPAYTYDLPMPATCTIHLDVDDGQGGVQTGDLTLSLSPVAVEVVPE